MELQLKARHFKRTNFSNPCGCAIAKAAKETFNIKDVSEGLAYLYVGKDYFTHNLYEKALFERDKEKAARANFDETIIRTIQLY